VRRAPGGGASEAQKKEWLPQIASGERVFALALTEARYGWSPESVALAPQRDGTGYLLREPRFSCTTRSSPPISW
jgi:alkylation response protein AidB-like acyl-CoA dehydrogenase